MRNYINYGNIACKHLKKTKLKKIFIYQKKPTRVIFFANRLAHAEPFKLDVNALNFTKQRYSKV